MSRKQILALQLLNNPTIVDLAYGGGAGGAKSMTACLWAMFQIRDYPGIRIGLGRKELTRLKQTTVVTLMREVHPLLGVTENEFYYNEQKGLITYLNKSSIQLIDLAYQPSDPEFDRFGSLNLTHTIIEEGGEVAKKARDIFVSRKNRFLNKEYNIVGKSIITCNPSNNFMKTEYYNPYKQLGGGEYRQWEHGRVDVDGSGELQTAYRVFLRSLPTDNPFLPVNYIENLRNLPPAEKKRLLEGNWEFKDDDFMLFKSSLIDRSTTTELSTGKRSIGVDISDSGGDKTILSMIEDGVLVDCKEIEVNKDEAIGDQIAFQIIKYAQQNNVPASQVGIDVIGVGASTRDFLRKQGWFVNEFVAGAGVEGNFKNLRGKTIWDLGQALDMSKMKIYTHVPHYDKIREQLMAHEYSTEERMILVKSKEEIKKVLGVSPDYAESFYIAYWVSQGPHNPNQDSDRIDF